MISKRFFGYDRKERIKDKQAKVKQLKKQKAKIEEEIRLEQQKARSINEFYKKYTANSKAEIALYGQEITPSMKISKKDEQLREDLYELADLFGDENLRTIASKYVLESIIRTLRLCLIRIKRFSLISI